MSNSTVKLLRVAQDVPPRAIRPGVALDNEQLIVLVLNVRGINAKAIENRRLQ